LINCESQHWCERRKSCRWRGMWCVIRVCGQVVEKLIHVHGNIGGFSGCGLLGTQGAEGGKEFVANSACIVEESANDALNSFDTFCGEREGCMD
jgi:hypothetical protein